MKTKQQELVITITVTWVPRFIQWFTLHRSAVQGF